MVKLHLVKLRVLENFKIEAGIFYLQLDTQSASIPSFNRNYFGTLCLVVDLPVAFDYLGATAADCRKDSFLKISPNQTLEICPEGHLNHS